MSSRRTFIRNVSGLAVACCGMSLTDLLTGCTVPRYVQFTRTTDRLIIKKADFLQDKYVMVTDRYLDAPIFVLKKGEDEFHALLMLCTHKACDVKPAGSILICPCHGSEFSQEGVVLKGPAEDKLTTYRISTDIENVFIYLK